MQNWILFSTSDGCGGKDISNIPWYHRKILQNNILEPSMPPFQNKLCSSLLNINVDSRYGASYE